MALPTLNVPTYELTLPSNNKKVTFRPFLVKEHKVLLTLTEADDKEVSRIIRDLVDVCTFQKLNVKELPHFDIEYIFLKLRSKSIGETVEVVVNCECGNKIETSFSLEQVSIEKDPNHTNKILLTPDIGIEFSYPNIDDVISIFSKKDNLQIFNLIMNNVKGIYDSTNYWEAKDQTRADIEAFIYSLTKEQFDKIEQFFQTSPKVVQVIETDCNQCGKHNVSRLEGLQNFFV